MRSFRCLFYRFGEAQARRRNRVPHTVARWPHGRRRMGRVLPMALPGGLTLQHPSQPPPIASKSDHSCLAYLVKLITKVSRSSADCYGELFDRLPGEAALNVDETGHPENRQRLWTWCFRSALETARRRVLWRTRRTCRAPDTPRTSARPGCRLRGWWRRSPGRR